MLWKQLFLLENHFLDLIKNFLFDNRLVLSLGYYSSFIFVVSCLTLDGSPCKLSSIHHISKYVFNPSVFPLVPVFCSDTHCIKLFSNFKATPPTQIFIKNHFNNGGSFRIRHKNIVLNVIAKRGSTYNLASLSFFSHSPAYLFRQINAVILVHCFYKSFNEDRCFVFTELF